MAISITPSPFGSVTVTLDGELGGVLSVGVLATSNSALNMDLGVPGPAGQNGQGVSAGGTTGQALVKSSNSDYATTWATISSGGGTWGSITGTLSSQTDLQNALNGKLSLTGGTMSGDITFSVDGNGNDLLIGSWGLGVENTNGQTLYLQPDVLRIYDSTHLTGTSLNGEGITFNDSSIQWTAYDPAVLGNYLPLTGGTVTGDIIMNGNIPDVGTATGVISGVTSYLEGELPGTFNLSYVGVNGSDASRVLHDVGYWKLDFGSVEGSTEGDYDTRYKLSSGELIVGRYFGYSAINNQLTLGDFNSKILVNYNSEDDVKLIIEGNGITFADSSVQRTAYDPAVLGNYLQLTGGTVTGIVYFTGDVEIDGSNLSVYSTNTLFAVPINVNVSGNPIIIGSGENGDGITFPDSSVQTTAFPPTGGTTSDYIRGNGSTAPFPAIPVFPPSGGTTSQYITGTGSLVTFPPLGDRYFTTSNSTLTCDSGDGKTMTIGTGLSYSRQQDITVSYNNANHMHGTVLTYDSATGVMTWDSNTHSGSGTYSSWEVNVGGVAGAVLPVGGTSGQVLAKINSTNFNTEWLSLGSMATQPASAYLSTASAVANYLTISSASSTYQTQSGMSAYLSTASAVANYQTLSGMSAYLSTASASANYLAKADNLSGLTSSSTARTNLGLGSASTLAASAVVQTANNLSDVTASTARTNLGLGAVATDAYATTAQAQAGTSTTTVVSPATLLDAKFFAGGKFLTGITWSTATSGTGANSGANGMNARVATAPTTATGYAQNSGAFVNNTRGGLYNGGIDWSKRVMFGGRFSRNTTTPDTNTAFRYSLGRFSSQVPSDIVSTDKQVGIKVSGSGAIVLYAANGSALSTVTSSFTPTNGSAYDVVITSDGAGNVVLYVNGSSVATSTGGPTSSQGTSYGTISFEAQNSSTLTNGNMVVFLTDAFVQVNV